MHYFLDTNILLHYFKLSELYQNIDKKYGFWNESNNIYVSVVSRGEITSIALRNSWGSKKLQKLDTFFENVPIIPINDPQFIKAYADIDVYSQGKHPIYPPPPNFSAINMGKNDLWIAANASVIGAKLITTDKDFTHLKNSIFLDVDIIEIEE